jgi:hypothetical protein
MSDRGGPGATAASGGAADAAGREETMLLRKFKYQLFAPECNPNAETLNALVAFSDDVSGVFPYLNAILKGCVYRPHCGQCGEATCLAFAVKLVAEGAAGSDEAPSSAPSEAAGNTCGIMMG